MPHRHGRHPPRICATCLPVVAALAVLLALALGPGLATAAAETARPPSADERAIAVELHRRFRAGGRYVMGPLEGTTYRFCKPLDPDLAAHPLLAPVATRLRGPAELLECRYPAVTSRGRATGWVVVLASPPENVAARLAGACAALPAPRIGACAWRMLRAESGLPWGSNNFIFPVAGFVAEPCPSGGHGLIGFRYGVGVRFGARPGADAPLDFCVAHPMPVERQRLVALDHPLVLVRPVARLAALSRQELERLEPLDPAADHPLVRRGLVDAFQNHVMENELCAVGSGYDRMMILKSALLERRPPPARIACDRTSPEAGVSGPLR